MTIGIVTTWFERGASYVSRIYKELLQMEGYKVLIYARGGENYNLDRSSKWNEEYVTRSNTYIDTTIEKRKLYKWIRSNKIQVLLFNEQQDFRPLVWLKKDFPNVKLGAYVDYYTEYTLPWFDLYDFLICNTKRHMQAMKSHPQKYYIRWGTDLNVFKPVNEEHKEITFFHSAGAATRKGTDVLVDAFINGKIYEKSKLIIHTQIPVERLCRYNKDQLIKYNVVVIEKTVTAPGLYHEGDIYVYPARLDGLGLTMYEALGCGLPMITSDFPPMNEVGDVPFVRRVKIKDFYCRGDGYYYPMVICDEQSLIDEMTWFIDHADLLPELKKQARQYAEEFYDIYKHSHDIAKVITDAVIRPLDVKLAERIMIENKKRWNPIQWAMKHRVINNFVHKN